LRSTDPPGYIPDFPSQRKGVKHEGDHKYKGLSRITRTFNEKGKLIKNIKQKSIVWRHGAAAVYRMHKVWKYTYYSSQESELLGKEHLM
jgi:hypothetical protein